MLGRDCYQFTMSQDDQYVFTKVSINMPEIAGTVLVAVFLPELIPVVIAGAAAGAT